MLPDHFTATRRFVKYDADLFDAQIWFLQKINLNLVFEVALEVLTSRHVGCRNEILNLAPKGQVAHPVQKVRKEHRFESLLSVKVFAG